MVKIGQVAIKLAGRDAGKAGVIVEVLDKGMVLIDGQTRRRKCNLSHLYILEKEAKIKKGASTEEVAKALKELGYGMEVKSKKKDKKEKMPRPRKLRKSKKTETSDVKELGTKEKKKAEKTIKSKEKK